MRVSPSADYAYRSGESYQLSPQKTAVAERIKAEFYQHRRRYEARRLAAELQAQGVRVGRFQIRMVMRREGLRATRPRRFTPRTTDSGDAVQPSPNLLLDQRNAPQQPREVIVGEITCLRLRSGKWGYLASRQDQCSKRVVGRAVEERTTQELVTKAFEKEVESGSVRRVTIVHTDRGSQSISNNFCALLRAHECRQSMSRRGNC